MLLIIEVVSFTILCAFLSAQVVYWFWWCMGSPRAAQEDPNDMTARSAQYTPGRIFSFLGGWICSQYRKIEKIRFEAYLQAGGKEFEYIPALNFWKSLGVCIYCFAVWAGWLLALPWYAAAVKYTALQVSFLEILGLLIIHGVMVLFFVHREVLKSY